MGVSINLHVYDYFDLIAEISKEVEQSGGCPEGRSLNEFVERVLPHFGTRQADKFIVLWNEYYEDYNAGVELFRAVEMYFGLEDVFLSNYKIGESGANAGEILYDVFGDDFEDLSDN